MAPKSRGITAPAWRGGEIENEPQLPLPWVFYPKKYGFYFAFASTQDSDPYFCECSRQAMQAHAMSLGLSTEADYFSSIKIKSNQPWRSDNFNPRVSDRIQSLPQAEWPTSLFREKLCHACNQVIPSLLSSAYAHASFSFEHLYWYVKQLRTLEAGMPSFKEFKNFMDANPERFALSKQKSTSDADFYSKAHRQFFSETEMQTKIRFGLHALGGSSQSEYLLLGMVKAIYPDELIQHKVRPGWLENLELDIWIPHLSIAIEYQGEQHYRPVEHWGGEDAFQRQVERDRLKRKLCKRNGVRLIEIKFNQALDIDALGALIRKPLGNIRKV
jgi:hypothetical protein